MKTEMYSLKLNSFVTSKRYIFDTLGSRAVSAFYTYDESFSSLVNSHTIWLYPGFPETIQIDGWGISLRVI